MSKQISKTDRPLVGTWRSDRRRTLKDWVWRPRASAAHRERIAEIFGHLILRYTRQKIHSELKGDRRSQSYRILGSDASSVAILYGDSNGQTIQHIHFDGSDRYWICMGRQREWFKRIHDAQAAPGASRRLAPAAAAF
jgi:hypothetical protein